MFGLPFSIEVGSLLIPSLCPVLGIPLIVGGKRSPNSPSLDRIEPSRGYVPGNVRIISDRANRLKSNRPLEVLKFHAEFGSEALRDDYRRLMSYVEREALLSTARRNSEKHGRPRADWEKVAELLNHICIHG